MLTTRGQRSHKIYNPEFLSLLVKFCTGFDYVPDLVVNPDFRIIVEFTFHEIEKGWYPMAHTCENTLILPGFLYTNGKDFRKKMREAVTIYGTNFSMA